MEIYKCFVPRTDYYKCKNLIAVIHDTERADHFDLTNAQYERHLASIVRKQYKAAKGTKSLYEILKELREEQRKKGSIL